MATLSLGSPLTYNNALTSSIPQTMPERRVLLRFRCTAAAKKTSDQIVVRRSAGYSPSVWSRDYILSLENIYAKDIKMRERAKVLKAEVKRMLNEVESSLKQLEFIDALQRLGISYHFEHEIENVLMKIYDENINKSFRKVKKKDLHAIALEFRLLRQHGFDVPQDVFDDFRNNETGAFIANLSEDIKGLLSLYEASYLATRLDNKLLEAKTFATDQLREFIAKNTQIDSQELSYVREMVVHALEMPFHWRINRLEARWYIDVYEKKCSMNPMFLEFAKLDFNFVQAVHQEDLKYVYRWWDNTRLAKQLDFARDRIIECFFWTIGFLYEPELGYQRRMITKVNKFITIIDDIYDIYGTPEELKLFTTVTEKWDVNSLEELPENMRLSFLTLYNEVNQNGCDILRDKRFNVIPYLKQAWTDLCKTYLIERNWHESGYKPSLEEYMQNAWVSISVPTILIHVFCIVSHQISRQTLTLVLEDHVSIVRCVAIILRLANDLETSQDEMARGDVPKSVQCYMHERGASEAEARARMVQLISDTWEELNYQLKTARNSSLSRRFIKAAMGLARMSQCMYQYGDGHGHPGKAKTVDRVLSLLVHHVP